MKKGNMDRTQEAELTRRIDKAADSGRRPRIRNAETSKNRILTHALREFSEHGFSGARVDRIARRARINKNLIYHYFKNKEKLFILVMEEAYRLIVHHHNQQIDDESAPVAAISNLVRSTFDIFLENPHLVNLFNTENLHRARHIEKSPTIRGAYRPLIDKISLVLSAGVSQRVFRAGIDPIDLFISITGISYFFVSNRHTLSVILSQDLEDPKRIDQRREHVVDIFLHALGNG
jgi:TetR/AcrR family transcriptional regulator